jgi:hypothetical protein
MAGEWHLRPTRTTPLAFSAIASRGLAFKTASSSDRARVMRPKKVHGARLFNAVSNAFARTPAERYVKGGVNIDAGDKRGVELCRPLPPPARHRARIRSSSACMPRRRFRPRYEDWRSGTPKATEIG